MTLFGYVMTGFAGVFWLFRVAVALFATMEKPFPFAPLNLTIEIILLFVTFICIVLVVKRNMLGAVIYMVSHFAYYGVDLYKAVNAIIEEGTSISNYPNLLLSVIGVILPFAIFVNIGLNKGKKMSAGNNKNTDWFYKSTEHDRVYDERADRNQYKF